MAGFRDGSSYEDAGEILTIPLVRILTCEHVMFYRVINFMLPVDTLKVNRPLRSRRQVRKEEKLL